jgi:hypothetical protein
MFIRGSNTIDIYKEKMMMMMRSGVFQIESLEEFPINVRASLGLESDELAQEVGDDFDRCGVPFGVDGWAE